LLGSVGASVAEEIAAWQPTAKEPTFMFRLSCRDSSGTPVLPSYAWSGPVDRDGFVYPTEKVHAGWRGGSTAAD
jgi:hypothetical protein